MNKARDMNKLESWENYRFASLRKHEVDGEEMRPKRNMGLAFQSP